MTGHIIPADTPCRIEGCNQPRMVSPVTGRIFPLCAPHKKASDCAYSARHYNSKKQGLADERRALGLRRGRPKKEVVEPVVKVKRLQGRPRPPTVIVNPVAGVVIQVRGNTIEREYPLPLEGLRMETIWILKRRGWQIRVAS